jgi:two-component system sensor histidine kinase YesM
MIRRLIDRIGWGRTKIRKQMYFIYAVTLLLPVAIIGILLIFNARKLLSDHYMELLEMDNLRVKTTMTETARQAYNISEDICFDSGIKNILSERYSSGMEFAAEVNADSSLDSVIYNYEEIAGIYIYTDNPTIQNYKQYHTVTKEIEETDWYQRAIGSTNAFWISMERENSYGSHDNSLCLIRRITLQNSNYHGVVVVKISDQYLRSKIDSNVIDAVSVDESGIIYSSKKSWYGEELPVDIDYTKGYYSYSGTIEKDDTKYFSVVSTTHLYMTDSRLYVCTLNDKGFDNINRIVGIITLILLLAIGIPGIILVLFTNYFTGRILLLRQEMHKASIQDYHMITDFRGHDELTDAFEDLKVMVRDIKEKDAKMYEAQLNEKELRNEQHIMEYKMLASQINPHYLYNTLETIRMKALTGGDRMVADSIKILGKTLHYVLENTGTVSTTLQKELDYIENYLAIQKMRFGSRINYKLVLASGIDPSDYEILPLLLQPIVENAIVHGLEGVDGEGQIIVTISSERQERLQISVSDNGPGMTAEELEAIRTKLNTPDLNPQSSIGLYNISQRIRLCYGTDYGIEVDSVYGEGTQVVLHLPGILAVGK